MQPDRFVVLRLCGYAKVSVKYMLKMKSVEKKESLHHG